MLLGYGLLALLALLLLVYCVLDVATTPSPRVRTLPRLAWLLIVLVLPLIGPAAWLLAGRPAGKRATPTGGSGRPGRSGRKAPGAPEDDAEFLRGLEQRAWEQRRQARRDQERGDDPS